MKGLPEKMGLPEKLDDLLEQRKGVNVGSKADMQIYSEIVRVATLLRERLSAALLDNQRVRWIPVSERLPEGRWADDINRASEQVIIATPYGQGAAAYDRWEHKWFTGGLISCKDHVWIHDGNVTHWMPLPDAPEARSTEK